MVRLDENQRKRQVIRFIVSRPGGWRDEGVRVGKVGVLLKMNCFVSGSPPRLVSGADGATTAPDACWVATEALGSGRRQSLRQRPPILLGSGNDGRLTLRSHCPVPISTPIAGLYLLSYVFLVSSRSSDGSTLFLCPFFGLIQTLFKLLRLLDPLLSPELVAGRLMGLSRWADHANMRQTSHLPP